MEGRLRCADATHVLGPRNRLCMASWRGCPVPKLLLYNLALEHSGWSAGVCRPRVQGQDDKNVYRIDTLRVPAQSRNENRIGRGKSLTEGVCPPGAGRLLNPSHTGTRPSNRARPQAGKRIRTALVYSKKKTAPPLRAVRHPPLAVTSIRVDCREHHPVAPTPKGLDIGVVYLNVNSQPDHPRSCSARS